MLFFFAGVVVERWSRSHASIPSETRLLSLFGGLTLTLTPALVQRDIHYDKIHIHQQTSPPEYLKVEIVKIDSRLDQLDRKDSTESVTSIREAMRRVDRLSVLTPKSEIMVNEEEWSGFGLRLTCLKNNNNEEEHSTKLSKNKNEDIGEKFLSSTKAKRIEIKLTLTSEYGYKPMVLNYVKKCGGYKKGLNIYLQTSSIKYLSTNDDVKKNIIVSGFENVQTSENILKEDEKDNKEDVLSQEKKDELWNLPERVLLMKDGLFTSSIFSPNVNENNEKKKNKNTLLKKNNNNKKSSSSGSANSQKSTSSTVSNSNLIMASGSEMIFTFQLGKASSKTKDLLLSQKELQSSQSISNISISILPIEFNQRQHSNSISTHSNGLTIEEPLSSSQADSYLQIDKVFGSLITNRTYYQKKTTLNRQNGGTFYLQRQTLGIRTKCQHLPFAFGYSGIIRTIQIRLTLIKPRYREVELGYRVYCPGWLFLWWGIALNFGLVGFGVYGCVWFFVLKNQNDGKKKKKRRK